MMYETWCGKIDEEAYEREKDGYSNTGICLFPKDVLKNCFEFSSSDWFTIVLNAEEMFGNSTWMDWGSFFCRGDYETMKSFLNIIKADESTMEKFEALPKEGDYGFVFIEDY